jgi:hypothetical protein
MLNRELLIEPFHNAANAYYYGDHITGNTLLSLCLNLSAKTFELNATVVKQQIVAIAKAKQNKDYIAIGDILKYEVAPSIEALYEQHQLQN